MFHKICGMLRCIQKSEASHNHRNQRIAVQDGPSLQQAPNITTLTVYKPPPPPNLMRVKQEITVEEAKRSLTSLMQIPPDLEKIQPRPSQVWNCDEIGIDPNGKWTKIVCTYKYCVAEQIWKAQTGERAPFWCTLLFFTRADGQCFIPPVVVHKSATLTEDLLYGIPDDWIVHVSTSGYMDRDGWFKSIKQFCKLSGAHHGNNQALFYDGHDSHWDSDALDMMANNSVHGFFLKSGDSGNDQPNDNGFNAKAKAVYNDEKMAWDEVFVTTPFSPAHMNTVIVKMWARLTCESGSLIKRSFEKTHLVPLRPPTAHEAASNAMISALQIGTGKKATELAILSESIMSPVTVDNITTTDPVVILKARGNTSRNLIIRSAAYDIINRSTVIPAQKIKDVMQELNRAKKVKIPNDIPKPSRMNPDSSSGLYVTAELRLSARAVSRNKDNFNTEKAAKRIETDMKNAKKMKERKDSYDRLLATIFKTKGNISTGIAKHNNTPDIKNVYQHLGGKLSDLPNGKRHTIVDAVLSQYNNYSNL